LAINWTYDKLWYGFVIYQIAKAEYGQRTSPWSIKFIYGCQAENEDENENEAGDEHYADNNDVNDDNEDDDKRPVTI